MDGPHDAWMVESSRDGETWRFLGKGWVLPGEPLLVHGASTFLRCKRAGGPGGGWTEPLERTGNHPIALLDLEKGTRADLVPGVEHIGLPVLLPGGEVGRLIRFELSGDGSMWTWALEFRGSRP